MPGFASTYTTTGSYATTSNNIVWQSWNDGFVTYYNPYTTTSTATCSTWNNWNQQYTTSITATSGTMYQNSSGVWYTWNQGYVNKNINVITRRQETSAERRLREQYEREQQQRVEEAQRKREEAKQRALALLKSNLSPSQRKELEEKNHFHLYVGDRKYRINRWRSRNVQLIDEATGRIVRTLCAHPRDAVPDEDTMLAQKLFLETAEEEFLKLANHS